MDGSDGRCGCLQVVSCGTVQMEINNCGSVSVKQSMLTCTGEALAAMLVSALVNTQVLAQTHVSHVACFGFFQIAFKIVPFFFSFLFFFYSPLFFGFSLSVFSLILFPFGLPLHLLLSCMLTCAALLDLRHKLGLFRCFLG